MSFGHAHQLSSNKIKAFHGTTNYMPYHGLTNISKPKWTKTSSTSTIKALNQRPRILMSNFVNVVIFLQWDNICRCSTRVIRCNWKFIPHTITYELNQKRVQFKFNLPSSQWMGLCMKAMVKITKQLKEIVQIMYLTGWGVFWRLNGFSRGTCFF